MASINEVFDSIPTQVLWALATTDPMEKVDCADWDHGFDYGYWGDVLPEYLKPDGECDGPQCPYGCREI